MKSMNTRAASRRAWQDVFRAVSSRPDAIGVSIPRARIPHPRDAGARPTTTWPVGQIADYALPGPAGQPQLVVREFPDRWEALLDTTSMTTKIADAVERDPSKALYVGAALIGGTIGTSVSGTRQGMFAGVGLGLLLAALLDERGRS